MGKRLKTTEKGEDPIHNHKDKSGLFSHWHLICKKLNSVTPLLLVFHRAQYFGITDNDNLYAGIYNGSYP